MAYNRSNQDLSSVFKNTISVDDIVSSGLKVSNKSLILNKGISNVNDVVGSIYIYASSASVTGPLTGSFTSSTVTTSTGLSLAANDFINITGSNIFQNNNVYEVASYVSGTGLLTIKTSPVEFFTKSSFITGTASGTFRLVTILSTKVDAGVYYVGSGSNTTTLNTNYSPVSSSVTGPVSSTNNAVAIWNGVSGKILKDSDLIYTPNVLTINFSRAITYGQTTDSYFIGGAGNTTLTGLDNYGFGIGCLEKLAAGSRNLASGGAAGFNLLNGNDNILYGYEAGLNYTSNESNNICISNNGVIGDNNRIRIGSTQTQNFQAGIFGVTPSGGTQTVIINSSGQLGSTSITPTSNLVGEYYYYNATGSSLNLTGSSFSLVNSSPGNLDQNIAGNFDSPAVGQLRYINATTRDFVCFYSLGFRGITGQASGDLTIELRINGTVSSVLSGRMIRTIQANVSDTITGYSFISLSVNQNVSLYVVKSGTNGNITVQRYSMILMSV